jgi:hypothetical protein
VALNIITLTHTVHKNSRGNVSWCNASDIWSSCENLKINTSKIILRRIVSQSVNRYHDMNDAHDSSMQSADSRHSTDMFCVASAYKWTIAGNCHRLRWVFFVVCFFKPLFSYWKFAQSLAVVFIWSTCLLIECLYCLCWVLLSDHLFSYIFFLFFFGASVLI